jgi:hypothetical protein
MVMRDMHETVTSKERLDVFIEAGKTIIVLALFAAAAYVALHLPEAIMCMRGM